MAVRHAASDGLGGSRRTRDCRRNQFGARLVRSTRRFAAGDNSFDFSFMPLELPIAVVSNIHPARDNVKNEPFIGRIFGVKGVCKADRARKKTPRKIDDFTNRLDDLSCRGRCFMKVGAKRPPNRGFHLLKAVTMRTNLRGGLMRRSSAWQLSRFVSGATPKVYSWLPIASTKRDAQFDLPIGRYLPQKNSPQRVVAAVVGVFDVFEIPVVRISPVVVLPPELPAVNAVAEKRVVDGNNMNGGVLGCDAAKSGVVSL